MSNAERDALLLRLDERMAHLMTVIPDHEMRIRRAERVLFVLFGLAAGGGFSGWKDLAIGILNGAVHGG